MCLDLNSANDKRHTAEEDIVVYKFLRYYVDETYEEYTTPYQNKPVEIGSEYTSDLSGFDDKIIFGLHSFANLEDAISRASVTCDLGIWVVCKCLIPKGSRYYKGTFKIYKPTQKNVESFASNRLRYLEIINKNENLCVSD